MTARLPVMADGHSVLLKLEIAFVLYWAALPVVLSVLYPHAGHPVVLGSIQWVLLALNVVAGFMVGCQFPLANHIWLKGRRTEGSTAGFLYACDLVGAFLGSVVVSVVAMPVLGILQTCLLAVVLKSGSLVLVSTRSSRS